MCISLRGANCKLVARLGYCVNFCGGKAMRKRVYVDNTYEWNGGRYYLAWHIEPFTLPGVAPDLYLVSEENGESVVRELKLLPEKNLVRHLFDFGRSDTPKIKRICNVRIVFEINELAEVIPDKMLAILTDLVYRDVAEEERCVIEFDKIVIPPDQVIVDIRFPGDSGNGKIIFQHSDGQTFEISEQSFDDRSRLFLDKAAKEFFELANFVNRQVVDERSIIQVSNDECENFNSFVLKMIAIARKKELGIKAQIMKTQITTVNQLNQLATIVGCASSTLKPKNAPGMLSQKKNEVSSVTITEVNGNEYQCCFHWGLSASEQHETNYLVRSETNSENRRILHLTHKSGKQILLAPCAAEDDPGCNTSVIIKDLQVRLGDDIFIVLLRYPYDLTQESDAGAPTVELLYFSFLEKNARFATPREYDGDPNAPRSKVIDGVRVLNATKRQLMRDLVQHCASTIIFHLSAFIRLFADTVAQDEKKKRKMEEDAREALRKSLIAEEEKPRPSKKKKPPILSADEINVFDRKLMGFDKKIRDIGFKIKGCSDNAAKAAERFYKDGLAVIKGAQKEIGQFFKTHEKKTGIEKINRDPLKNVIAEFESHHQNFCLRSLSLSIERAHETLRTITSAQDTNFNVTTLRYFERRDQSQSTNAYALFAIPKHSKWQAVWGVDPDHFDNPDARRIYYVPK